MGRPVAYTPSTLSIFEILVGTDCMTELLKTATAESKPAPDTRLKSLDALRGFDMFWIAGGDTLARLLLDRFPPPQTTQLKTQLEHVDWEGFRLYDLIFPLFMFLVGCVIPLSLEKYRQRPADVYLRIIRRTVLLFVLGLVCNGLLKFEFSSLRYAGVLQRIAICYGIAAILFLNLRLRGLIVTTLSILLGYWAILSWVPVPGGTAGDLSKEGNLSGYLDRLLLPGRILGQYYGYGDNEGILSTLPAVVTVLLGIFAGLWLKSARNGWMKSGGLLLGGILCLAAGLLWGTRFPVIKNLWSSSFVLVAGGYSLLLLTVFYTLIDVLKFQRWSFFWIVIGVNAITIYVVPRFVDFDKMATFSLSGTARLSGDWSAVVLQTGELTAKWLFLYFLYRNRMFLRL